MSLNLPCGMPLDEVYAQVIDQQPAARPEHRDRCPHHRAALAEYQEQLVETEDSKRRARRHVAYCGT
jgi:hypothetical protein